jgi:hypothetical protein
VAIGLVVVAVTVVGVAGFALPRLSESASPEEQAVTGELMTASQRLLTGLDHERLLGALDQIGHADLLVLPVEDTQAARRVTDDLLAGFESALPRQGEVRSHYDGALAALDDLEGLRGEIDGRLAPAPGVGYANQVLDRYDTIIRAIHDANTSLLGSTVRDAELRPGLELLAVSRNAVDAVPRLMVAIAFDIGQLATPEAIASVASVQTELQDHLATATGMADGTPFASALDRLEADLVEAELQEVVDAALQTGQAEIFEVVTSALSSAHAWDGLASSVENTMTEPLRT